MSNTEKRQDETMDFLKSGIKEEVLNHLKENFGEDKIRETDTGFRFNVESLSYEGINSLHYIPAVIDDIFIKRSGTGVVVIINL